MISMMALQGLRTIEVHRASVEDLTEKGEHLALLVRGKTRDRLVYLRPDIAAELKQYLALRGEVARDPIGTPLFSRAAPAPASFDSPHHPHADGGVSAAGRLETAGHLNHAFAIPPRPWATCTPATCGQCRSFWVTPIRE